MKLIKFLLFTIFPLCSFAQDNLTLSAAIETAVKNNYQLSISRNDLEIAKNNNTIGNAGFLPAVNAKAAYLKSSNNTEQTYSDGRNVNQSGASVEALTAGAQLDWTVFNGLKMFVTKSRLVAAEQASGISLKIQLENTIEGVMVAYFNIIKISQQIKVLEETIAIYDERIKIADARFNIGSASKLDLLQAKVDRNARAADILQQKVDLDAAMADLNKLLGRNEFIAYTITDSINFKYVPVPSDFSKTVLTSNNEIKLSEKKLEIEKYFLKEIKTFQFPAAAVNVGYNYADTKNEVGFILKNKNQGPAFGFTLSWNLFNGFNTRRQINNEKINFNSTDLLLSDTRSRIQHDLYVSLKKYQSDSEILKLEEENWNYAHENVIVSLEAYRLGSISGLQLKEAQNSYEDAFSRLVEARYQSKVSETTLMRLNGDLVK